MSINYHSMRACTIAVYSSIYNTLYIQALRSMKCPSLRLLKHGVFLTAIRVARERLRRHVQTRHAHPRGQAWNVVPQLQILHDRAQPAHPKPIPQASLPLSARRTTAAGTEHVLRAVVEPLLRLAPVASLREVGAQEGGVDAAEVVFSDVGFESARLDEEDVAQLADELETVVKRREPVRRYGFLIQLDVPDHLGLVGVYRKVRRPYLASISPPVALTGNFFRCSRRSLRRKSVNRQND